LIPLCSPKDARRPTALALGSFDGIHAGHRAVIAAARDGLDPEIGAVPSVVSFWPHPREVLFGEARLRLDLPQEKLSLLEPLETLQAKRIAVGTNFRFGHRRAGDAEFLQRLARRRGVEVRIVDIVEDADGRMSSSRIRSALEKGALTQAEALLGRPYRFQGKVVRGRGLGREIGWPTANLQVDGRKFLPGLGVYAAWARLEGSGESMPAVMNLGPQPTVDPNSPSAVEVHLLDRSLELEDRELVVEPVCRLRGQQKFNGLQELSAQIGHDAEAARQLLRDSA
jgi:riboflavin kinase/FMN adenylyltransferase